jgi:hypothetical protein
VDECKPLARTRASFTDSPCHYGHFARHITWGRQFTTEKARYGIIHSVWLLYLTRYHATRGSQSYNHLTRGQGLI